MLIILSQSQRYTPADRKFFKEETARMIKENIIGPSVSPWRAQVLATSNENHKKEYTINMFTELNDRRYIEIQMFLNSRLEIRISPGPNRT